MKKWLAFFLALVMCLALCACGGLSDKELEEAALGAWEHEHDDWHYVLYFSDEDEDNDGENDCLYIKSDSKTGEMLETELLEWHIEDGKIATQAQNHKGGWTTYEYSSKKDTLASGEVVYIRIEE